MNGISPILLPEKAEILLLVKMDLSARAADNDFEQKGAALLPPYQEATSLTLLAAGRDIGEGSYFNFWRMPQRAGNEGGLNDLVEAMRVVQDIPEYGPVDDMIETEAQNLAASFYRPAKEAELTKSAQGKTETFYVVLEYAITSERAGSFWFDLRAYLESFEQTFNWNCLTTCYPMTGNLATYLQLFQIKATDIAAASAAVKRTINSIQWQAPTGFRILTPALYDPTHSVPAVAEVKRADSPSVSF